MQKVDKQETPYEVVLNGMGHFELRVNGNQSICPLAGHFPVKIQQSNLAVPDQAPQERIGGFIRFACTTGCPMAELEEYGEDVKYIVHCGGSPRKMNVTLIATTPGNAVQSEPGNEGGKLVNLGGE